MKTKIIISKATVEDAPGIAVVEKSSFSMPWSEKAILESMQLKNYIFLKAEADNRVIGYIGFFFSVDSGDVTNIAVLPEYRRQGVGKQLLVKLIDECRNQKISSLLLEVRETNLGAMELYRKTGFEKIGVRKNFYEKPVENAVLMQYICK